MTTKFKTPKLSLCILNMIMKRIRNSERKRNLVSVPKAGVNQECDSSPEEKLPQDMKSEKSQDANLLAFDAENLTYKVIQTNRKSSLPGEKKLNLKKLKREIVAAGSETHLKNKSKLKGTVSLEMMKEELKQLEDLPLTKWEMDLMSARLPYSFFDTPCEQLAQNLLGKILVRKLENGTILKGRIVETESYLGTIDKASHTYQYRVSPRNLPMYMPPGTIYVYFTYGMYHCFNLSSQEAESRVQIRSVEPLIGLEYMELLLNTQEKEGQKEKEMVENIQNYKTQDLCNHPSKICTAFNIEKDEFNEKLITQSTELWIEKDSKPKSLIILSLPNLEINPKANPMHGKRCRYFISGSPFLSQNYQSDEKFNS
ncbi:putative 3-methyladenine DNA glycosylase [Belonocnema kinseyi]|uniref:putative 3-methyladenine DNA glycosylase n=1 Tax=Belonocnema kinseyi TaxID=2817044 RepID=UPI00143D687F|nr:putative 3-methyladenine DNA glycosylase [Belonocnema kinseyi]